MGGTSIIGLGAAVTLLGGAMFWAGSRRVAKCKLEQGPAAPGIIDPCEWAHRHARVGGMALAALGVTATVTGGAMLLLQ